MVKIKRAYELPKKNDGYRVLVDRLWPRGRTKRQLALNEWAKALAPSTELRKYFAHDPERWAIFEARYRHELKSNAEAVEELGALRRLARRRMVTLVYGAQDQRFNQAVVLKKLI